MASQIRTGVASLAHGGGGAIDPGEILNSVGEVAYVWHLDSDRLGWGPNATAVLEIPDSALIAFGSAYAQLPSQTAARPASTP